VVERSIYQRPTINGQTGCKYELDALAFDIAVLSSRLEEVADRVDVYLVSKLARLGKHQCLSSLSNPNQSYLRIPST
jgi:hypothetical protein